MKKAIVLILLIAIVLIGGAMGGAYYYHEKSTYITTEDASVTCNLVTISSPQSGRISTWRVKEGDKVKTGQVIGTVQVYNGGRSSNVDIKAERDGTIIKSDVTLGKLVSPTVPLAMTANLNHLYIMANIKESDLDSVKEGHSVNIYLDAFPKLSFKGTVKQVGLTTNSTFSRLPENSASGNYTKVTRRIPVYISINNKQGKRIIPGLNATVKIDR